MTLAYFQSDRSTGQEADPDLWYARSAGDSGPDHLGYIHGLTYLIN